MPADRPEKRKSVHRPVFDPYLRTGERLTNAEWLSRSERKFNPYHDERGRFTSPPGVTVSGGRFGGPGYPGSNERHRSRRVPEPASASPPAGPAARGSSRADRPRRTSDSASSESGSAANGFRSDLVQNAVSPQTSHASTFFELRKRQAYLDSLRGKVGPNPDPVVKADLDDLQRRLDADRVRLDEDVRRIVDPQTNELLRAGLAPFDIGTGLINIGSGEGELRDYLSASGVVSIGAAVRNLSWLGKLPRVKAVVDGAPIEIIQLGGPHWRVRLLPGYHSHHIPSKKVSPLRESEGPAIAMLPADHRKTLSYGNGTKARASKGKAQDRGFQIMKYVIRPLKGVNNIEFGMHVSEVWKRMGAKLEQFKRGGGERHPDDHYVKEGVFCYYDDNGFLEAMEFDHVAPVFLDGVDLFKLPIAAMAALLSRLDSGVVREDDGAISHRLSLAAWAPDDDDEGEDAPVEAFLTGRPGYYDFPDTL